MRVPSGNAIAKRRIPQQKRGQRRVDELLEGAASVIADVGYEAATMTAIAKRAGASIGAVYQYFPSKESIGQALRALFSAEMDMRWTALQAASRDLPIQAVAEKFVEVMVQYMEERPAYVLLLDAPITYRRDESARVLLRKRLADFYQARKANLPPEEAYRIANVSLQIIKSMNQLYAHVSSDERIELVAEYKRALSAYLGSRLG